MSTRLAGLLASSCLCAGIWLFGYVLLPQMQAQAQIGIFLITVGCNWTILHIFFADSLTNQR